jgi:membrane protease YdiL (CAAX protease family)
MTDNSARPTGRADLIESLILFLLLFPLVPGMASPPRWGELSYYLGFLYAAAPQIALLLFRLWRKDQLGERGLLAFKARNLFRAGCLTSGLFLLVLLFSLAARGLAPLLGFRVPSAPAFLAGGFVKPGLLPLAGVLCLFTGYREELFFRVGLIPDLEAVGMHPAASLIFSSLAFAVLHVWQGWLAVGVAFALGLFLGLWYRRYRNAHEVALAHAAYNFAALALSMGLGA